MLPEELAAIKDKLILHMTEVDEKLLKKVRADNFYSAEADYIIKLVGLGKPVKLEFFLLFLEFESNGLRDAAKPIHLGYTVVGKDLAKLEADVFYIDCLDDRDAMIPEYWLAQNVHHKTMRQVIKEGILPVEAAKRMDTLHKKYPGILIAGQNVAFDKRMLDKLYQMAGQKNPYDYHCLDLTGLSIVHLGKKSLKETMEALGLDEKKYTKHDALGDANATADAFIELMRRL